MIIRVALSSVSLVVLLATVCASLCAEDEDTKKPETITNSIGMKLAPIPEGEFQMGSPASEQDRNENEQQHRVRVTRPFYMGIYPVTQAEYQRVMGSNPSWFSANGGGKEQVAGQATDRFPVEQVAWIDAWEFCRKLSRKEGKKYRLPTEAEWELACRAGTSTPYSFGQRSNGAEANCNGDEPYGTTTKGPNMKRTTAVGSYQPNGYGLHEMHGNVMQWCSDWFDPAYYANSPTNEPAGPDATTFHAMRGGAWDMPALYGRSADRHHGEPLLRRSDLGFRVLRER